MDNGLDPRRPLDPVGSIKTKIGLLVALSILAAVIFLQVGIRSGVPAWLTVPVTIAVALGVTQWLARGMTAPLREMTAAAKLMARGNYDARVTATSADEVGALGRAFNRMAGDLASADQERRELVATVSHELRTPLAGQRALLENLVDGVVSPDDASLETALKQSERLSSLVEDLLDLSRVDEGAGRLMLSEVKVADLLDDAVAEARVGGRQVQYTVNVEPANLVVQGDRARLQQVVANLLDNAARHSPVDGMVRVSAVAGPQGRWALEVTDDGPGIPADRAEALFARYGTTDEAGGGTGLGLAIARWVCQLHGGTIRAVAPAQGQGARIRMELPQRPAVPASTAGVAGVRRAGVGATAGGARPQPAVRHAPGSFTAPHEAGFWPERASLRTAPLALFGSVAVGLVGALVLPDRAFGIGTFLVLLLAGGLWLHQSVYRSRVWTKIVAVLCLGLGVLVFLRASEWLAVLAVLAATGLATTALTDARRPLSMLAGAAAWVMSAVRGMPLLGRTLSATSRHQVLWPVLRTGAVSLVLLVVFVGLFASGDPVFGAWVSAVVPEIEIADMLVLRAFTWFLVGGMVLAGCYLALNPPRVDVVGLREPRPVMRAWEWQVPVGVVIAVYVAFLVAQASAMWGGHEYIQRTTGLSYADYVHQGFGQLTVATLLTLVTVAIALRKAPRRTSRDVLALRSLLLVLGTLTLVVVGSALYRMWLYQEAYGHTVLRLLVIAFELWLGLLVVMTMVAVVRLSWTWLPRAAIGSGAAFLLVLGLMNPESFIAEHNIERYQETGRLDVGYLATLGPDAVPAISGGLPNDLGSCIARSIAAGEIANGVPTEDSWAWSDETPLEWNWGRYRAESFVEREGPLPGDPGCPFVIGE